VSAQVPITFQYFYDETGQLIRAVDSTGVSIEYVYDAVGNMLEVRRTSVSPTQLQILSFSPQQGGAGALVTIVGFGFSSQLVNNIVSFNGVPAAVSSSTGNAIAARVPVGASTGPISVTVATSTASSSTAFTVLALPSIASVTPRAIDVTHPPGSITLNGTNLSGAQFTALPTFVPPALTFGTPQVNATGTAATVPVNVASNARGTFVLVGSNAVGSSDTLASGGNTISLVNSLDDVDSDGDGYPDGLELLYGSDPSLASSIPNVRVTGDVQSLSVSVVNRLFPLTQSAREVQSRPFSIVNSLFPSTLVTTRQAQSRPFALLNDPNLPPTTISQQSVIAQAGSALSLSLSNGTQPLIEGQSVVVAAAVSGLNLNSMEFSVNGVVMHTDTTAPFRWIFTVPARVTSVTFSAAGVDASNTRFVTTPVEIVVQPDPAAVIRGRVVDRLGSPVQRALVEIISEGVDAEYFDFGTVLSSMPDLTGRTPDRLSRMTAINMRNPNGMFGSDPLGSRLAPDYAGRLSGSLNVATAGAHTFTLGASEGARLLVDGVTVVDMTTAGGQYQEQQGAIELEAGVVPIEVQFYQGAGNGDLKLTFTPPGDAADLVPPAVLSPIGRALTATTDANGFFSIQGVPTALSSVQVRATATGASVTGSSNVLVPAPTSDVDIGDVVVPIP
jgi:YD repeat-containing protein